MARVPSPPCRLVAAVATLALFAGGWAQSASPQPDGATAHPLRSIADGFPPARER